KINISNNTKDTLPTKTTLKSARDLLEFSKTQTQEVKTLKDLNKVAEDLKLNIQKINLQKDNTNQEIKFKGVPKQEMLLDKQILKTNENVKTNTANPKVTQKESKESLNILSNLLQDKEMLNKESPKDSKASPNKTDFKAENKESLNVKNSTQNLKKEEKNLKDSQNVENLTPTKEKIESKTDFKTKEAENLEEKEKVKAKNIKESPDKPTESLQAKAQEPSKEIPKQEVGKQDFVVKNEIKHEEKVKEKTNQEEMLKESQNTKVASQSKATQESLRNPFALKEQKEVKESFLKEEKEDKRNIKNSKTTTTQSLNTLGNAFKEENIKQDIKQQDIFLENLLKTTEKSAQSSKETSKEAMLEVSKENTEKKAKINQEIYQASTQAQVENRLSVQNTFLHFSDKLREALQNYRPPITRLSLELNPENLGSVELTITKRGENVSVQITSNQTALQLFMQNAQEFKNSLSNLGLNDVNLEFKDNAGNLLDNGDFNGSNGGNSGGFGGQNQGENPRKEQNLTQNSDENSQNTQKWNENSLHIYKEVNNPYAKVALVEINFSYYA
ncbi:flagellar hook-length control protein FliK, partial [Helicobacter sp. UBA3407]|uniref:flagellar hook-length control protein FliK n=1 Tax=Helicobacter sp. UBA3407 TaxID=1946588 RepID=UPI002637CCE3